MKAISTQTLTLAALCGVLLSSCVYKTRPVPDMPYRPQRQVPPPVVVPEPVVQPLPADPAAVVPAAPVSHPSVVQQPVAPAAPGNHITQAPVSSVDVPAPAPTVPAPAVRQAPAPVATPTAPAAPQLVTNNGPIPVATRVPGDPLRVYNPLDPSKTIKIIDRNGNPQPSGKKLKVPGTNFLFIVP